MKPRSVELVRPSEVQAKILKIRNNAHLTEDELKKYTLAYCNNCYWWYDTEFGVCILPQSWYMDYGKLRKKFIYSNDSFIRRAITPKNEIIAFPVKELSVNGITYIKFKAEDLKTEAWFKKSIFRGFREKYNCTKIGYHDGRIALYLYAKSFLSGWIETPPADILNVLNKEL